MRVQGGITVEDLMNGRYLVSYMVLDAGDYMLSVKVFGEDIQGDGSKARIHTVYIYIYTRMYRLQLGVSYT